MSDEQLFCILALWGCVTFTFGLLLGSVLR